MLNQQQDSRKIFRYTFIMFGLSNSLIWIIFFLLDISGVHKNVFNSLTSDWFMDFYNTIYYSVGRNPYSWGWIPARNYLPFSYMVSYPLSFLFPYDTNNWNSAYASRYSQLGGISVGIFLVVSFGLLFYFTYKACKGREYEKLLLLAVLFFSSVTLFNFDRANLQILTSAFLIAFLMTYRSENRAYRHIGFICLAMASAMKIFPAAFIVLLLYEKKYKDTLITVSYCFLFAFLPFFWLQGRLVDNIKLFIQAMIEHASFYARGDLGICAPIFINQVIISPAFSYILFAVSLLFAGYLQDEWKKLLLLSLVIIMTSGQQGYYCLMFLFYPIILFFNKEHTKFDVLYLYGFIFILSPIQYDWSNVLFTLSNLTITNTICVISYLILAAESVYTFIQRKRCLVLLNDKPYRQPGTPDR